MSTTRIEQEQVNSSLPFQRLVGRTRATEGSGDSYLCPKSPAGKGPWRRWSRARVGARDLKAQCEVFEEGSMRSA